jgi:hypothetical protein
MKSNPTDKKRPKSRKTVPVRIALVAAPLLGCGGAVSAPPDSVADVQNTVDSAPGTDAAPGVDVASADADAYPVYVRG